MKNIPHFFIPQTKTLGNLNYMKGEDINGNSYI